MVVIGGHPFTKIYIKPVTLWYCKWTVTTPDHWQWNPLQPSARSCNLYLHLFHSPHHGSAYSLDNELRQLWTLQTFCRIKPSLFADMQPSIPNASSALTWSCCAASKISWNLQAHDERKLTFSQHATVFHDFQKNLAPRQNCLGSHAHVWDPAPQILAANRQTIVAKECSQSQSPFRNHATTSSVGKHV